MREAEAVSDVIPITFLSSGVLEFWIDFCEEKRFSIRSNIKCLPRDSCKNNSSPLINKTKERLSDKVID
jgi:hypothetical protein